jgi:GNAT superfamily N-acetyltransferase
MEEGEVEELISLLREMMDANGFAWAREEAEAAVEPRWQRRWLARALLDAAQSVTVDLAEAELSMFKTFGAEVQFERDDGAVPDGEIVAADLEDARQATDQPERLSGQQRRQTVEKLADLRGYFDELRERLDGIV